MLSELVDVAVNHGRESTACEGDISILVVGNGVGGRKNASALEERA
jgi:hypothetical protein